MSYYDEVKTADSLIEELRARIAELEARCEACRDTEVRTAREVCEHCGCYDLGELESQYDSWQPRVEQAEAELAASAVELDEKLRKERRLRQAADSALAQALRHPNSKLDNVSEYLYRLEHQPKTGRSAP